VEGAEELVGDVGEEEEQTGEEVVDLGGGGEVVEVGGEGGGNFGGLGLILWQPVMCCAEWEFGVVAERRHRRPLG
jgi:hypothetical protein